MKNRVRQITATIAMSAALTIATTGTARAQESCQPGINAAVARHFASYNELIQAVIPVYNTVRTHMAAVMDQATYDVVLADANTLAANATLTSGRVVLALPDGTVMLDTSRDDNTADPKSNSYQHFQDKTINENHNSRIAFFAAQEYECGFAVETKTSTTTGQVEDYVGARFGTHLDSIGTLRISQRP